MRSKQASSQREGQVDPETHETDVLEAREERALLEELVSCKAKLAEGLAAIDRIDIAVTADDPQAMAQFIAAASAFAEDGPTGARLGAIHRKYTELRSKLAMANLRLVAHVARRFRDRGVPYADLLQEGFCGLLEAIDRFDLDHQTKLATYATWWIRQAIQRAVAAGAYPVRLTPRHLRQLARSQNGLDRDSPGPPDACGGEWAAPTTGEQIMRIHRATRPAISLDAALAGESDFSLLQTVSDRNDDPWAEVETDEAVRRLIRTLRPREQQVLSLRFGLGGQDGLSLSQIGRFMDVSKERVRQIQGRALDKLRGVAERENLVDRLPGGD
jgi:RNA polymerase primary sigma factor